MNANGLWAFLWVGYLLTVLIETPVLLVGLSARHTWTRRLWAGLWLTACTYPVVVLVLPMVFAGGSRLLYLAIAETFAPMAECLLFWSAFGGSGHGRRDMCVIVLANLTSFALGEALHVSGWFAWLFGF